jgi:fungal STAND N-terminal Goodbye domain
VFKFLLARGIASGQVSSAARVYHHLPSHLTVGLSVKGYTPSALTNQLPQIPHHRPYTPHYTIPSPNSMSSITPSSSNFHLISKALSDYATQTGIDLTTNPFADELQNCDSVDAISQLLQDRAQAFKTYRDEHRKLINCLSPVVQFLRAFSGTLGEALVLVSTTESIPF